MRAKRSEKSPQFQHVSDRPLTGPSIKGGEILRALAALGLDGIAESLSDGRIRVIVTGLAVQLDQLEPRLRQGPPASKVDDVIVQRDDVVGALETSRSAASHRSVLRRGAEGTEVFEVQRKLGISPQDGVYGARTEAAVRQFQIARGLPADGIVGTTTWKEIDAAPMPAHPASPRGGGRP
jgi:peptidoglycan hydrolase-like protein with peptidoglycan-binding domain